MLTAEESVQLGEYALAGHIVHRVNGSELAARSTRGILGIPDVQVQRAAEKLERELSRHAVVKELAEYSFRVVEAGGHVDLPALGREWVSRWHV